MRAKIFQVDRVLELLRQSLLCRFRFGGARRDAKASRPKRHSSIILFSALLLVLCVPACRTLPPLPSVNLAEPGWTVREGQAIWRPKRAAPEIAGEILVATQHDGRALVQFTKTPFPFVSARTQTNAWQIEFPTQNKRYSGRGEPPARLLWFQLPRVISGAPTLKGWTWHSEAERWRLENVSTGESLEGYFTQ